MAKRKDGKGKGPSRKRVKKDTPQPSAGRKKQEAAGAATAPKAEIMLPSDLGDSELLTEMQLKFVECWRGNATDAARRANYAHPEQAASKLLANPVVAKAIQAKQAYILAQSAERLGDAVQDIPDEEIVSGLRQLARLPAMVTKGNINGQGKAWEALARIKGLLVDQTLDLNELLRGTTKEQQEFAIIYGHIPTEEELVTYRASRSRGSA